MSSVGFADVLEVNIWNPTAGNGPLTFEYGQEARAIHQELGANVSIGADREGRMHYALTFKNWTEWAKFGAKLQKSEAWSAFLAKTNAAPSAELEDNYMLNVPSPGAVGSVYEVFIWDPAPGRGSELIQSGMQAEAIHEKSGADVAINVDRLGRMHYVMSFDSWEAWAKFEIHGGAKQKPERQAG
jgi:hypothetical protein